jgi:hypothetical protein
MIIKLNQFKSHEDSRGGLVSLEADINIPFRIARVYYLFNTKNNVKRGMHAHYNLKQMVIAVSGSCKFLLDNGKDRHEILLNDPKQGLLIDSLIWREMYDFSHDCVLMVLADAHYDELDYIRDYNIFLQFANADSRL